MLYEHSASENFIKGFKKASDMIRMEKPDFIFAPIIGAVPFVDILTIVDRHFQYKSVEYLPNSSRFENREELMAKWYSRFYDIYEVSEPMKILCLDEVLSGASAVVGHIQFKRSLEDRARKKAKGMSDEVAAVEDYTKKLKKNIDYKILGFVEEGYERNHAFNSLVNDKLVHMVNFKHIVTIDNISLNPIRLKPLKEQENGRTIYKPEIDRFDITSDYMNFLRNIASYVGVTPSTVNPVNLSKIEEGLKRARE